MLLKKFRNQLVSILNEHKLPLAHFEMKDDTSFYLQHTASQFEFKLIENISGHEGFRGGFYVVYKPDIYASPEPSEAIDIPYSWSGVLKVFTEWASALQEELELPDLWAEAVKTAQLFAGSAEAADDKFTRTELAEVQSQLRQLQQSFTAATLPEAARKKLIELTQTAAVKAEGLTKKDWQNWIIGGFIQAITALMLNPTQASEVLKLVKAAFGGLFLH
ncbi:hypothetical protein [Hymenobacter sp. GOD-10R]|uniref:hypothetical protein n=1 Tax=Hymenobacter sp. GOD-10R TaxID=3093922 RepID=UPI002D776BBE|nr:hypothetical protein [Hymenobacter sp. GOD-10R]WRQ31593.1 hypothetical protein SD425_28260 [Hymenobacter sp. GOD-10R]